MELDYKPRRFKEKKSKRKLAASYDASKNTPENRKHWENADDKPPALSNSAVVRQKLRMRAGYERDNNPYCSGMVSTLATDTIGYEAPKPQVNTNDSGFNSLLEDEWENWSTHCLVNLPEKLRIMDEGRRVEGENFLMISTDYEIEYETNIAIGITNIAAGRVTDYSTNSGLVYNGIYNDDGVLIDTRTSRPVGYKVTELSEDIMYGGATFSSKRDFVPARYCLHWFAPRRASQFRGICEITPSLSLFAYLRRYDLATLTAAETAALLAGVMKTTGTTVESAQVIEWTETELQRGTLMTLPDGWDAVQFKPEQPISPYEMFVNCILRQIGRAMDMPFGVVAGDSSRYNYSSARLDYTGYDERLKYDRKQLSIRVLNKLWNEWIREMAKVDPRVWRVYDKQRIPVTWQFTKRPSIDPEKDARTATEKITNGTSNLAIECAKDGHNWEEVAIQRSRELKKLKELGLTSEQVLGTMNTNPSVPSGNSSNVPIVSA